MMTTADLLSRMVIGEKALDGLERIYDKKGAELIKKAWKFSKHINENKLSKSGELFVKRLQRCACALIYLEAEADAVAAALLANAFEDADVKEEEIREEFPEDVLHLIKNIGEAQVLLASNKSQEEKMNQLKAMDKTSILIFLAQ